MSNYNNLSKCNRSNYIELAENFIETIVKKETGIEPLPLTLRKKLLYEKVCCPNNISPVVTTSTAEDDITSFCKKEENIPIVPIVLRKFLLYKSLKAS